MKGLTHQERRELKKRIVEYRKLNHTIEETMEHFDVKRTYVRIACRNVQWDWVRDMEAMSRGGIKGAKKVNGDFQKRETNVIRYIAERAPNFEYVGGFTGCDDFVHVRCKTCGTVLRKSLITVRHGRTTCDECKRLEQIKKQEEQKRKREEREEQKNARLLNQTYEQIDMSICPCCGALFLSSHGRRYCSEQCSKRVQYAVGKDKRLKKIKNAVVDKGITLKRLYERDNGKCYICGHVCDWSDCERRDGAFIAYDNYPSIDHVIPLSKGGLHAWDNVRLACRGCNTKKRDRIAPPCRVTA